MNSRRKIKQIITIVCLLCAAALIFPMAAQAEETGKTVRVGWHEEPYFITDHRSSGTMRIFPIDSAQESGCPANAVGRMICQNAWTRLIRLIIGSPVCCGGPTGMLRCFMERLVFPDMSYNDYSSTFAGKADVDIIITMNVDHQVYQQSYEGRITEYFAPLRFLDGEVRIFPVCNTLQVKDCSLSDMAHFCEVHKRAVYHTEFPAALECAFELGRGKQPDSD